MIERMLKAIAVIEGSLLVDEPEDKRLAFIYRMAHVGRGECEHDNWIEEMEKCYQQLIDDNIIHPIELFEPKPDEGFSLKVHPEGLRVWLSELRVALLTDFGGKLSEEGITLIIAKLQARIEEAFTRGITQYREEICPVRIEEAKKQAGERIIEWLESRGEYEMTQGGYTRLTVDITNIDKHLTTLRQALKTGGKE